MPLRMGQLDAVGLGAIGHEVAWHAARGTHSRHRLRWLVWLVPLAARLGVHPRRHEVFFIASKWGEDRQMKWNVNAGKSEVLESEETKHRTFSMALRPRRPGYS